MTKFKTIAIDKILVPERLRVIEDDHAYAIQASIVEHGLINPITVRNTPRAALPYTLVAGAHRLRAYELADEDWSREIEALVIDADKEEAQLVEISENLFRNELSALDRAMFVVSYRDIWESKHGAIKRGGDQRDKMSLRSDPISILESEAAAGFSRHVADRLGISSRTIKRANEIGQKLAPDLRKQLRGTPDADNQALLLKLAAMPADRQHKIAVAYTDARDIKKAVELTEPNAKAQASKTVQAEVLERLVATWARADEATRKAFLKHIAPEGKRSRDALPKVSEILAAGPEEPDPNQITIFDALSKQEVL